VPSNTKKRLIDTAGQRFYRDGFRNVGIDQILGDVGISKTAFYKHFSCKDDLMLAVLDEHDQWFRGAFMEMVRRHGGDDPVQQLFAVMDATEEVISSDDFHGCIFVNAAMEFPLPHDPAHAAAAKNKEAIESIVREIAGRAGAKDPVALAQELCLIVEGAYVTYQVTGRKESALIAKRVAAEVIEKHVKVKRRRAHIGSKRA
jgi:AcrR family transcriptional regulator